MNKLNKIVFLVILPPGNIGKSVIEVQNKTFSETGLYSAVCLPSIIPISYLPPENCKDVFNSVISNFEHCWEITTADFINYKNSIFLELSRSKNGLETLSKIKEICPKEKETILPAFSGFFICSLKNQKNSVEPEDIIKLLRPPPELRFKSFE